MTKTLASILTAITLAAASLNPNAQACTGAKPVSMGNAGVASMVSRDDSEVSPQAIYWNQAALAHLNKTGISYTRQFGEEENARYDNVVCFTAPLTDKIGVGIQYEDSSKDIIQEQSWHEDSKWIKVGAGYLIKEAKEKDQWSHSMGGALTLKNLKGTSIENQPKITEFEENTINLEASYLAERKNLISEKDKLSLGILTRYIDGREVSVAIRPGAAYTTPNSLGDLTISTEFYGVPDGAGPRVGLEQTFGNKEKNIALRAGYENTSREVLMAGIGLKYKNFGLDLALTDKKVGWLEASWKF